MKKHFFILIIAITSLSGCVGMLDVVPENVVTMTRYFKTEQDLEALVSGAQIISRSVMANTYPQELSGEVFDGGYGLVVTTAVERNWKGQFGASWQALYSAIYQSDLLLENYHKVPLSEHRENYYVGQACFVKANMYFLLGKMWGDAIIVGSTTDPSPRGKRPVAEVLDTALKYAVDAYTRLNKPGENYMYGNRPVSSKQYGDKANSATLVANIYALKASVEENITEAKRTEYLEQAVSYLSKVIEKECGNFELDLTPEDMVVKTLSARNGNESIFEVELNMADGLQNYAFNAGYMYTAFPTVNTLPLTSVKETMMAVSAKRVEKIYGDGADRRRDSYFYEFEKYKTDQALFHNAAAVNDNGMTESFITAIFNKYRTAVFSPNSLPTLPPVFVNFDCNKVIWRLADVILLRAECNAKLGNSALAIEDLNSIRLRAFGSDTYNFPYAGTFAPYAGETDLRLAIFREREKELIGEGHRYFDLIRMRDNDLFRKEMPYAFKGIADAQIKQGALYLPIDNMAFNMNPELVQNEYWFNNNK